MSSMVKTVNGDLFIKGCPRCGYDKVQYSDEQWVLDFHCDEEVEFCPSCGLMLSDLVFHLAQEEPVASPCKFRMYESIFGPQNDWVIRYNKHCGDRPAFSHD